MRDALLFEADFINGMDVHFLGSEAYIKDVVSLAFRAWGWRIFIVARLPFKSTCENGMPTGVTAKGNISAASICTNDAPTGIHDQKFIEFHCSASTTIFLAEKPIQILVTLSS
jgi:hypothetical protein